MPIVNTKSKPKSKKLADVLKKAKKSTSKTQVAPWAGPCDPGENGGITQSLLCKFLVDRERFRLLVINGYKSADSFNHRLEYGQMWHLCEEALAKQEWKVTANKPWEPPLRTYCQSLCKKYKTQQEQVQHWYNVCKVQFPIYVKYWARHPDVKARNPLLQEEVFHVPYLLPSGRSVYLQGKFDSVDMIGKGKSAGIYLQENKSKGDIDVPQLKRQLTYDIQTMVYLVALQEFYSDPEQCQQSMWKSLGYHVPIAGIRYNVIRRPLSGGKGSIVQRKGNGKTTQPETNDEFYARLAGVIEEDPSLFFMRWKVEILPSDIERFKREFLNPVLEQLCDWWEFIRTYTDPFDPAGRGIHWRMPYGVYSPLLDGGSTELDEYLASGSTLGLEQTTNLFPELKH
ncbi:PD-(D/E)XK nuclease family protein [Candidatus Pacearchaeota archaeon]|jgi:hypothetical protein|nr:PD-(D/E)XK nuclease family protein [Candidatus Pacearchaeota archaeon]